MKLEDLLCDFIEEIMSNKLSKEVALYAFREEKIKWFLEKYIEQIEECRIEIQKYKRPSPMWKAYNKEIN